MRPQPPMGGDSRPHLSTVLEGWRYGIRAKLLVAVVAVAVMTLLAGLATWSSYSEIDRLLSAVTHDNLPGLSAALKLSEATARVASGASGLDGSLSQSQRQTGFLALSERVERLLTLVEGVQAAKPPVGVVEELRVLVTAIKSNVANRNILVEKKLELAGLRAGAMTELGRVEEETHGLLLNTGSAMATVVMAENILRTAAECTDMEKLPTLRRDFDDQARRLVPVAEGKGDNRFRAVALAVLQVGTGADNIFELRSRQLLSESRLAAISDEGRDLVERISMVAARSVAAAETAATDNEDAAEQALGMGRLVMIVIALCTFLGPLLFIWLYLGRNIVSRLAGLAASMHRIVEGDYQTRIVRSGNDEIAEMAGELVIFQDAMARVQASSSALKESEWRFRTILETSPLALAISRVSDHRLVYVNPRWTELYLSNLDGWAYSFYVDPKDRDRIVDLVLRNGFVGDYESRMRRADGTEFWVVLSAARIDMDGQPAVIVSSIDITKRKEQEQALAEAKKLAEEASEAKTLFLATMSHEIRTPMNGVLTMAQLLEEMQLPQEQKEMARVIRDSAVSLLTIINDILDFSKIEAGKMTLETVETSMVELAEGVAELLAPKALEKGIGLVAYVDPNLPATVLADPVRLRQIITNLAGNAVKFTDRGSVRVTIEAADLTARPLMVTFSVNDTGIGLDSETQTRLFEPFSQADASISRRYGGTGLGLSICRRLVAMMGGEIGVTSKVNEGSTFWFTVPLEVADARPDVGPDLSGVAVLVLAEGSASADVIRQYLGHLGAQVAVVASPDGALAAVRAAGLAGWGYDVVLMDGAQDFRLRVSVARAVLAAAGSATHTRIVMVAPHASYSAAANDAREAGLFATVSKPIRRGALWRIVAAAAGRATLDEQEEDRGGIEDAYVAPLVEEAAAAGALVLVAEDNPTNQVVIRRLMERLGYAIEIVANGVEAWERMQIRDYGLLLTDCHMPEMDGYELTSRVRAWEEETQHHIPIVALTADALTGTARKCRECGMDAFLAKPVDLVQLDITMRKLLPRAVALRRRRGLGDPVLGEPVRRADEPARPPVLDLAPMREIFGDVTEEAKDLLKLFVDTTRPLLLEAERALSAGDSQGAREAAHSCKGAGNSAGAYRFARICAELEKVCSRGDLDTARTLVGPATAAFDEAAAAVAAL